MYLLYHILRISLNLKTDNFFYMKIFLLLALSPTFASSLFQNSLSSTEQHVNSTPVLPNMLSTLTSHSSSIINLTSIQSTTSDNEFSTQNTNQSQSKILIRTSEDSIMSYTSSIYSTSELSKMTSIVIGNSSIGLSTSLKLETLSKESTIPVSSTMSSILSSLSSTVLTENKNTINATSLLNLSLSSASIISSVINSTEKLSTSMTNMINQSSEVFTTFSNKDLIQPTTSQPHTNSISSSYFSESTCLYYVTSIMELCSFQMPETISIILYGDSSSYFSTEYSKEPSLSFNILNSAAILVTSNPVPVASTINVSKMVPVPVASTINVSKMVQPLTEISYQSPVTSIASDLISPSTVYSDFMSNSSSVFISASITPSSSNTSEIVQSSSLAPSENISTFLLTAIKTDSVIQPSVQSIVSNENLTSSPMEILSSSVSTNNKTRKRRNVENNQNASLSTEAVATSTITIQNSSTSVIIQTSSSSIGSSIFPTSSSELNTTQNSSLDTIGTSSSSIGSSIFPTSSSELNTTQDSSSDTMGTLPSSIGNIIFPTSSFELNTTQNSSLGIIGTSLSSIGSSIFPTSLSESSIVPSTSIANNNVFASNSTVLSPELSLSEISELMETPQAFSLIPTSSPTVFSSLSKSSSSMVGPTAALNRISSIDQPITSTQIRNSIQLATSMITGVSLLESSLKSPSLYISSSIKDFQPISTQYCTRKITSSICFGGSSLVIANTLLSTKGI